MGHEEKGIIEELFETGEEGRQGATDEVDTRATARDRQQGRARLGGEDEKREGPKWQPIRKWSLNRK